VKTHPAPPRNEHYSQISTGTLLSVDVAAEEVLWDIFRLFGDVWEYHHHGWYPFDPSLPCQMNQLVVVRPQLVIQPLGRILIISKLMTELGGLVLRSSRMWYLRLQGVGFGFQEA